MKIAHIGSIILTTLFVSCYPKKFQQSACSDKESILKAANGFVERKFRSKIENFQVYVKEDENFYILNYTHTEDLMDPLLMGIGGMYFKVSKKDCRVIEYFRFK